MSDLIRQESWTAMAQSKRLSSEYNITTVKLLKQMKDALIAM